MSSQAFSQNFPGPKTVVVDKQGTFTQIGLYLLRALWLRTGQGNGIIPQVSGFPESQNTGPLTATGNSQATALVLTDDWNNFGTVPVGSGCMLQALKPGQDVWVWNNTLNNLNVFPNVGYNIDAGNANAAQILAPGKLRNFSCWTQTQINSSALWV